jgi:hypothetical protein
MAGMKIIACLAASFLIFQQSNGCDETKPPDPPPPKPVPQINRFVPVSNHGSADVALDTVTGELCRTWEWEYRPANNPAKGGLDLLPTCVTLYERALPLQAK